MAIIYVPIVMYGLGLFIVVLQELYCLPNCLHVCTVRVRGCYHITKVCCSIPYGSEIATNVNTLPEAVYCCFTITTLFTELFTCFYDQSYRLLSLH